MTAQVSFNFQPCRELSKNKGANLERKNGHALPFRPQQEHRK